MTARISLRVSTFLWTDPARRAELLELLREYRDTIDEVAFFTSFTHPPLPLPVIEERAALLAEIIPQFRQLGLTVGINHLATIGHLDENLENSLSEPWQRLVDVDGGVSASCYCARDPAMQDYVRRTYIALARARPEFIWVDDDVRLESHWTAIRFACFCPLCLRAFSQQTGRDWTREMLKSALSRGPQADRLALRRQWLANNRRYIEDLLRLIREAVDSVDRSIQLGLMDGEINYSGQGHPAWAAALAGSRAVPVKWRPGAGFYTDQVPADALGKAHKIGRIIGRLPPTVSDIQSEHENFPYQRLKKSATIFTAEIAAYIGAGCTGTALNCMGISQDPLDEYRPYFAAVRARREFYDRLVSTFGRSPCEGIWVATTADHFAALQPDGDWFTSPPWGGDLDRYRELAEIGLPMAYARAGARVTVLRGEAALEFSKEDLREILAGGVLLDGPAVLRLHELGLGEHVGFAVRGTKEKDTIEQFTDDRLNGRFAGWHRDCRPSFWPETTYLIEPLTPQSRPLARIIDFAPKEYGPCAGVFENSLGGRVAVLGYYPWSGLQSLAKSSQMKALGQWVSRDTLPAWVDSYARAALWCRRDPQGRLALLLLNASLDPAEQLVLRVRRTGGEWRLSLGDGTVAVLAATTRDGEYSAPEIPRLPPWEAVLLSA